MLLLMNIYIKILARIDTFTYIKIHITRFTDWLPALVIIFCLRISRGVAVQQQKSGCSWVEYERPFLKPCCDSKDYMYVNKHENYM